LFSRRNEIQLKKRILFLVLHRWDRSPGQRYRHEQYVQHLEAAGFQCDFSPLLNESEDRIFYASGNYVRKIFIGLKTLLRRFGDIHKAKKYDFIYIYRDAYFFGSFIEKQLAKTRAKLIYDFDDAIWLKDENPNQGLFNKLKTPDKISRIIAMSDRVIAGNEYLASYARQFNPNITIIPSTVDMARYVTDVRPANDRVCIGWTGSFSTIKHFETLVPALMEIKRRFGEKVYFKLIGDPNYSEPELGIQGISWRSDTEAQDLAELSIGVMPLPDNDWTRGKCAMKGLQYMALGIPTIMSPVGVNAVVIQNGENGFLASSTSEWVAKLSQLIDDALLRERIGQAGKMTVEMGFSVEANVEKWLGVFN
jgi:glycosyltransferase involved in cell wall biosynthesis